MDRSRNDPSLHGRDSEYRRLWQNEWSSGVEGFIDMDHVDRAIGRGIGRELVNRLEPSILGV